MSCFAKDATPIHTRSPDPSRHVNYVKGMVLGVDDFTQEFAYLAGRDQWLARDLIGYGTVRGLDVRVEDTGEPVGHLRKWKVSVTAGTALDPCGRLICVPRAQCGYIDDWLKGHADALGDLVSGTTPQALTLDLTLAYRDCATDATPIPGEPCRSEAELMAPSRIADDFLLELSREPVVRHAEEDAVRRFTAWLAACPIVDSGGATPEDFAAALAIWPFGGTVTKPGIPRAKANEYLREALRIWVTRIRPDLANDALQSFAAWLGKIKRSATGAVTRAAFTQTVAEWAPGSVPPDTLIIAPADEASFLADAARLWATQLRPAGDACGGGSSGAHTGHDERVLLARLKLKIRQPSGQPWQATADAITIDESERPVLAHLRLLSSAWLDAAIGDPLPIPPSVPVYETVAAGYISGKGEAKGPVLGELSAAAIERGKVLLTFAKYEQPTDEHQYIVNVLGISNGPLVSPVLRIEGFNAKGIVLLVNPSAKTKAPDVQTLEDSLLMMVEINMIHTAN